MLLCLRMLLTSIRTMRMHHHIWIVRCLNLQLMVYTRIVFILILHDSLPRTTSGCPDVPLVLVPSIFSIHTSLRRTYFVIHMKIFCTFTRRRWLEKEVVLLLLSLRTAWRSVLILNGSISVALNS